MKSHVLAFVFCLVTLLIGLLPNHSAYSSGTINLVYNEAQTVYLGNLARRDNGIPPLRWNTQLTEASRWFAWDSVENRPEPYCGHDDTQGGAPWDRAWNFGYRGFAGAENAFCGYVTPEQAIEGWMNSPGHRDNLLNPTWREVGLGYYLRESDFRGYEVQLFGTDAVYPPVIIDNEAIHTLDTVVNLYIYDRAAGGGFAEMGPASQMMISNTPCFPDGVWEPYTTEKNWTLEAGGGWRSVYVKTRDAFGRMVTVNDMIYLGNDVPLDELGLAQASSKQTELAIQGLNGDGLPLAQLSMNWVADDTYSTFGLNWGAGEQVTDPDAWGGTAFRLETADSESYAWVWTTEFVHDLPMEAYVRLKVSDNSSGGEVARFSISANGTTYGPLSLTGQDFAVANEYQEFVLPFTFHTNEADPFLIFNFWRSGNAIVSVDAVTIFTAPQPITSPFLWSVPGENYRGQGLWVRYSDGNGEFSAKSDLDLNASVLAVTPPSLTLLADQSGLTTSGWLAVDAQGCPPFEWQAVANQSWLQLIPQTEGVMVRVDPTGLQNGTYQGSFVIEPIDTTEVSTVEVPVTLYLVETLHQVALPIIQQE